MGGRVEGRSRGLTASARPSSGRSFGRSETPQQLRRNARLAQSSFRKTGNHPLHIPFFAPVRVSKHFGFSPIRLARTSRAPHFCARIGAKEEGEGASRQLGRRQKDQASGG